MSAEVGSLVPARSEDLGLVATKPAKRKREQTVLDEDEWLEKIEAIIQRDYFPDLPKLESELEWLEAVRSKDPVLIRQAQANITQRRAGLRTPMGHTPATFATPAFGAATPATDGGARQQGGEGPDHATAAPNMGLDRFMAMHTSEDNASFNEILEGINKRRREKYAWLHKQRDTEVKLLEDKRPLDGFGTSGQPDGALLMGPYIPDNHLYYGKEGVPFSDKELAAQVQGPPKQISAPNTRLPTTSSEEVDLSAVPRAERGSEYDPVATPAFTPGEGAPPPMTWGRVQATPARLEDEGAGPRFKVPDRKPKDILGHRLAEGARLNLQKRAALMSPSALRTLQKGTPRTRSKLAGTPLNAKPMMSPAAHKLASSLRGKATSADAALRASYSRSSLRRPGTSHTPALPDPAATPAILHEALEPPSAERRSREAALRAFDPRDARSHALKAFEPTAARRDALKAFGKITDNLLDL